MYLSFCRSRPEYLPQREPQAQAEGLRAVERALQVGRLSGQQEIICLILSLTWHLGNGCTNGHASQQENPAEKMVWCQALAEAHLQDLVAFPGLLGYSSF